jgi:hypothetical protein
LSLTRPLWRSKHCPSGKIRHGSKAEAEIALDRMVATKAVTVGELEVYRCRHCKRWWHLGHPIGYWRNQLEARASKAEGRA